LLLSLTGPPSPRGPRAGCFHGSELINVFDLEIGMWGEGEVALGRQFVRYWTRFATTGNPNGGGDPVWLPYGNATADNVAQLDTNSAGAPSGANVTMITGLKSALCDFWDTHPIPSYIIYG
jgi:para-nitrobenzyl esterase